MLVKHPANTKHLYNICIMLDQRQSRPGFNSGIYLELDLIPSLIPGIAMGKRSNF